MFDSDTLLDSVGGSLLNDLLSDLNAAVDAANKETSKSSSSGDDGGDDIFALLEQELTSSYNVGVDPSSTPSAAVAGGPPLGVMGSAAAFVVNQQAGQASIQPPPGVSSGGTGDRGNGDAWSAALSQFGGMSLAADFLAADAMGKKEAPPGMGGTPPGVYPDKFLFEEDEEYALEEEVKVEGDSETTRGGLAALLGASMAAPKKEETAAKESDVAKTKGGEKKKTEDKVGSTQSQPQTQQQGPPPPMGIPGMMIPHPPNMMMPLPPGGPMPPGLMPLPPGAMPQGMMMPPGVPNIMMPQGMIPPPPHMMHPGMMPPRAMMPPPMGSGMGPGVGGPPMPPLPQLAQKEGKQELSNKDFPALGSMADETADKEPESDKAVEGKADDEATKSIIPPPLRMEVPRAYFNNTDPNAPPVDARRIATKLMPSRDVSFIVHCMLRPLQSLDTYNDDYYHYSMAQRRMGVPMGGVGGGMRGATPVTKDVKEIAHESETKFQEAIISRASKFSDENKSLGQMVKTNVKRPKALLTTPVMNKDNIANKDYEGEQSTAKDATDAKYDTEQRKKRISVWKARVAIDRGYSSFLSLIELRRLIQANAGSSHMNELMGDVKTNVDGLHSSLGVSIKVSQGNKNIEVDEARLGGALSLPKGRVLCARVIEDGILPHLSACHVLPVTLRCILSWPAATAPGAANEGEDRLLRALTGLVRTPQPSVDPAILLQCLEELTLLGGKDVSTITGGRMRMELVHAILSVGKSACTNGPMGKGWVDKEKSFLEILKGGQK